MKTPVKVQVQHTDAVTFVQVQRRALGQLRELGKKSTAAVGLVLWMAEMMDRRGVLVASRGTMARCLDVSESTIKRALALLVSEGWVQRINLGPGSVAGYAVNARVAWSGRRDDIPRLAAFQATLLAYSDEQTPEALEGPELKQIPRVVPPDLATLAGPAEDQGELDL